MPFEVTPLANVGAEVIGFDIEAPVTEATKAEARRELRAQPEALSSRADLPDR